MNKKRDLNSVVPFMISSIARRQNEETLDFGIITLEKFLNCDKIKKSSKNRIISLYGRVISLNRYQTNNFGINAKSFIKI